MKTTLKRSEHISLMIKHAIGFVYWHIPGKLITIKGKRETYTVYRNLMVKISDGQSNDFLPLNYCAQEFVDNVLAQVEKRWFVKLIRPTERQCAYLEEKEASREKTV